MNLNKYKRIVFSLAVSGLLLIGLFLLLNGTPQIAHADPGDLFVTTTGSGDCSQANPCDLQNALGTATDGDTIYIAEGAYTGTSGAVITVTHSITLAGGWDGATTPPPVRDPDAHPTTIDGEGTRRGIYIVGPVTVTVEGLTIANGKTISTTAPGRDGAGLYARDAVLTLRHTNFYSNVVDVNASYAYGGGAAVEGGSLLLEASVFRGNSAWAQSGSSGGGLSIFHPLTATVTGSLFQDNDAWSASGLYFNGEAGRIPLILNGSTFVDNGQGHSVGSAYGGYAGALEVTNAQARIEGNVFRGSKAVNDGAVDIFGSDLVLTRNVITGNQSMHMSGLYLSNVSPFTVTNNVIAGNHGNPAVRVSGGNGQFLHNTVAGNESDYGVLVDSGATATMTNTILVSHTVGISVTAGSTATLESTLWGSGSWANGTDWGGDGAIVTGTVNVWGDPAFVNPDGGDYHIASGSAAIDAGVDAGVTDDIDGNARPRGSGYDIGADECAIYLQLALTKTVSPASTQPGEAITYTIRFSNTGTITATNVIITDTLSANVTNPNWSSSGITLTPIAGQTYAWSAPDLLQGEGGVITITGVLTKPLAAGTIPNTVTLAVSGTVQTANANLTVENVAPVAAAGADQQVSIDEVVTLNGSGTDDNGDALTYGWAQTGGSAVTLSDASAQTPTFTAPSTADVLTFTLTVTDTGMLTDTDKVVVSVTEGMPGYASLPPAGGTIQFGLDMGGVKVGSTVTSTLTISETGDATLNITSLVLSGPNAGDFSVSPTSFSIVDGGAAQTVNITCTPASYGLRTATLTVNHNAAGSPATYTLNCTGKMMVYLPLVLRNTP